MSLRARPSAVVVVAAAVVALLLAAVAPVVASPAPVQACSPCDRGFTSAAQQHDLVTDVASSEATVRMHRNDSATWTVRVVPTNETVLNALAENETLARSVAGDSFGVRYGGDIEHELLAADVRDGAFVVRYRTLNVVEAGPFDTHVLTYFRDSPGQYIYTDLGADELTVVAPEDTTVARGFGDVDGRRMTATALPDTPDGPFVVAAPSGTPLSGVVGWLTVVSILSSVIVRNLVAFVAIPALVLLGGVAALRRSRRLRTAATPGRLGGLVAAGGAVLVGGSLVAEVDALPLVTSNLLVGSVVGGALLVIGVAVAAPAVRDRLTVARLVVAGVAVAALFVGVGGRAFDGGYHALLASAAALFPFVVALGRADAASASLGRRAYAALAVVFLATLVVAAPVTSLGGTLFFVGAILLTLAAVAFLPVAAALYALGASTVTEVGGASAADAA
ncbi:hypothetical protein [Halobaculum limi]|uniref:hypothetical protein n=1 Tax=Halobaculum limi TaxID=3031916 RepID=UPI00240751BC|nr:hypothetical protein [Halobaculum sp. YSMS11]